MGPPSFQWHTLDRGAPRLGVSAFAEEGREENGRWGRMPEAMPAGGAGWSCRWGVVGGALCCRLQGSPSLMREPCGSWRKCQFLPPTQRAQEGAFQHIFRWFCCGGSEPLSQVLQRWARLSSRHSLSGGTQDISCCGLSQRAVRERWPRGPLPPEALNGRRGCRGDQEGLGRQPPHTLVGTEQ